MRFVDSLYKLLARTVVKTTGKGEYFFARHVTKGLQLVVKDYVGQYKINIDTTYIIEACIWLYGSYDQMMMKFLRARVKPGQVMVDVGANCGAYTLAAAALMNKSGHIYAFEPGPPILARLQANVNLNPDLNQLVTVVPFGLGQADGQFFYKEEVHNRGNASLLNTEGTPVQVIMFDDWAEANHLEHLDLIKIDVEGMEFDVLLGMEQSLKTWHPVIYFETLTELEPSSGRSIQATYEYLIKLGYQIVSGEDQLTPVSVSGPYPRNSVALPV